MSFNCILHFALYILSFNPKVGNSTHFCCQINHHHFVYRMEESFIYLFTIIYYLFISVWQKQRIVLFDAFLQYPTIGESLAQRQQQQQQRQQRQQQQQQSLIQ